MLEPAGYDEAAPGTGEGDTDERGCDCRVICEKSDWRERIAGVETPCGGEGSVDVCAGEEGYCSIVGSTALCSADEGM